VRKEIIEFKVVIITLLLLFSSAGIIAQTIANKDTLIQITKIKSFLISNPDPQLIVEIRNDMTICFYSIIPENFSKDHPGFKGRFVDSTSINIENHDFIDLEKIINEIDLEKITKLEKSKSENGIKIITSGGGFENYIIELSNQTIEFRVDPNSEAYLSSSAKEIRNIFDKLEDKYKPKK